MIYFFNFYDVYEYVALRATVLKDENKSKNW